MKRFVRALAVAFPLLLLISCQPPQDVEKEKAALHEQTTKFVEAFNGKNVDALMALYWNSPDLVFYPPDTMKVTGYDGVRQLFTDFFAKNDVKNFAIKNEQYKVSGDMAFSWGEYSFTIQPTGGSEMQANGRYISLSMKHEGNWLIAVDHASMPMPPPPPPAMEMKKKK